MKIEIMELKKLIDELEATDLPIEFEFEFHPNYTSPLPKLVLKLPLNENSLIYEIIEQHHTKTRKKAQITQTLNDIKATKERTRELEEQLEQLEKENN